MATKSSRLARAVKEPAKVEPKVEPIVEQPKVEPKVANKSAIGEAAYNSAVAMAAIETPLATASLRAALHAKDVVSLAPIVLYVSILKDLPEEKINAVPRFGSRWDETDNPEIFMYQGENDDKEREYNWFNVYADSSVIGRENMQQIEWCRRVIDPAMKKDDIPSAWLEKNGDGPTAKRLKDKLGNRKNNIRQAYKFAFRLLHQIDAVDELAGVGCSLMPTEEGAEFPYEPFIEVKTKNEARASKDVSHLSVGNFLRLDPLHAAEQKGTYQALIATLAREPKKPGDNKTGTAWPVKIETPQTFDRALTLAHDYFEDAWMDKKGDKYAKFLKFIVSDEGKNTVVSLGDLKILIEDVFSFGNGKVASIYATHQEQEVAQLTELERSKAQPANVTKDQTHPMQTLVNQK